VSEVPAPTQKTDILHVTGPWIVLYGNPNTGKTSIFNRLTGMHQKIGNYPGVTVERKEGRVMVDGVATRVFDLPGTYSLAARSLDEEVAVDMLSGRWSDGDQPDVAVCVVDAGQLERHLLIALQVADFNLPQVIAVNFSDEARERGCHIHLEQLAERLGVPVVATVGATGEGIEELCNAISLAMDQRSKIPPTTWPEAVEKGIDELDRGLKDTAGKSLGRTDLRRALFDNDSIILRRLNLTTEARVQIIESARMEARTGGMAPHLVEPVTLRKRVESLLDGVVTVPDTEDKRTTRQLDPWLLHPIWGTLVFLFVMFILFQSVYFWAAPVMDLIDAMTGAIQGAAAGMLEGVPLIQSLIADGIIGGVGAVVIFLPQILILYAIVALLEDSGYLARPAYLMDRLFSWTGMNGKSFVPLLSSYACAIPGIMASRTIEDPRARLTTNLVAPLMSCSARLPVYVLLIGAFIEPRFGVFWAGVALFAMHFVGLAVALPLAWFLNRFILKVRATPFLLELPPFRKPRLRDVGWKVVERGKKFLMNAGTIIFAISVIVWALLYFPRPEAVAERVEQEFIAEAGVADLDALAETDQERLGHRVEAAYVEQSYLGRAGQVVQPVFAPAGFDWKISIAILASFPAREVIVATLGIIYELGSETDEASLSLRDQLGRERWTSGAREGQPVFTIPVVFALLVFYALCLQCGATVAVLARETSWRWGLTAFALMTALAWIGAVATYQLTSAWGLT